MNSPDNGVGDHFPSPLGARMVLVCLIFLTWPLEKRHVFVFFCVFLSTFGQYWSIFVRTYLLYGTAYCTVRRKVLYGQVLLYGTA